jgi:hypothetical protein
MKIFTKRNAVVGWTAWKVGKVMLKKKTKSGGGGKKKVGILAGIGAAIGITALLKRKRSHSSDSSSE